MTKTNTMAYEDMPVKKTKVNKILWAEFDRLSTPAIVWFLVKRHAFALVSIWAIVVSILWAFPPTIDLLRALFGSVVK